MHSRRGGRMSNSKPWWAAGGEWCMAPGERRRRVVRLAAFPKCFMDELCVTRSMSIFDWIDMASHLPVDGVEMYDLFLAETTPEYLRAVRDSLAAHSLAMPMMCYSPDFTQPDPEARRAEVEKERRVVRVTAALGGKDFPGLSGERTAEGRREHRGGWGGGRI